MGRYPDQRGENSRGGGGGGGGGGQVIRLNKREGKEREENLPEGQAQRVYHGHCQDERVSTIPTWNRIGGKKSYPLSPRGWEKEQKEGAQQVQKRGEGGGDWGAIVSNSISTADQRESEVPVPEQGANSLFWTAKLSPSRGGGQKW